ncbi:rhomboid family intramembrane serine protease [Roseibium polysiphoniae]|uniref:Rhomboid family intramembrane serine protease n=1 Tax=Roseibium polysiphoniae TaxID=2571221 RepID=A0A944CBP9_9HYPH|nr:rhomboid family intramembrane serine protease [Roseibium polysiphoniae]MBS8260114.1 rhomboid family intramembrane serine protease [Roseibium polysiphoniae]
MNQHFPNPGRPVDQPAFNLPSVVFWLGAIMIGIHILRVLVLPDSWNSQILLYFAFWPVRYDPELLASGMAPGGLAADIWAFVTYGLLHGGATHIIFNLLWMAIFGSAVARRFGTWRFLVLSALCAIAGAATHLLFHFGESTPMIGASAAVSGHMAAALRFVFELGGPLGAFRRQDLGAYRMPAVSLRDSLANRQVLGFMAVWFGLNILFGIMSTPVTGGSASIAWEAHIGGFLMGLLLFPLLDPVPRRLR